MLDKKIDAVNDFINLQLNSIQICLISVKKSEKFTVLKNDYFKKLIRIAVFFYQFAVTAEFNKKKF